MKKYKLGEIGKIVTGKTPSTIIDDNYKNATIPFYTPEDVAKGFNMMNNNNRFISEIGLAEIKNNMLVSESVLVGCIGSDMGNVAYCNTRCATNQQINTITDFKENVIPLYVYYKLSVMKSYFRQLAGATTTPILPKSVFENIVIDLPDFSIQKKIACVLNIFDRKISLNRAINQNLEAMAKQLYDYWFVQFDFPNEKGKPYKSSGGKMVWNEKLKREIPEGWKAVCIKDLIHPIERGISYSSNDLLDLNATPMVNLACFSKSGNYRMGEMKYFSGNIIESKMIFPMDMLIACTDMTQGADIIGRPILVPHEYDQYTFSTDLALIKPLQDDKMFLYQTLRTSFYHDYIRPFASGTNVKHLAIKGVEDYTIALPDIELRMKFDKLTNSMFENISSNINEIASLTKQRDELLPLLMNGQVSVNGD